MFRKTTLLVLFILLFVGCDFNVPTTFSEDALKDNSFSTIDNKKVDFQSILNQYNGETILVNVWASWCKDCIVGMPDLKDFQKKFPKVKYVFLSTDRSVFRWKKAMKKYNLKGAHFFMKNGLNSGFGDFLNSNWIPRYMVINKNGKIDLFKAKRITDKRIVEAIKK